MKYVYVADTRCLEWTFSRYKHTHTAIRTCEWGIIGGKSHFKNLLLLLNAPFIERWYTMDVRIWFVLWPIGLAVVNTMEKRPGVKIFSQKRGTKRTKKRIKCICVSAHRRTMHIKLQHRIDPLMLDVDKNFIEICAFIVHRFFLWSSSIQIL